MIIIGEKLNGSIPSVAKAIAERNEKRIRSLAIKQEDAEADFLDVCASVPESVEVETLKWMLDLVQDASDLPICLDSPSPDTILQAMPFVKKPGLINSVSMEGEKIAKIFPVIAQTGWKCIALCSDETGIPDTSAKRLKVFERILQEAVIPDDQVCRQRPAEHRILRGKKMAVLCMEPIRADCQCNLLTIGFRSACIIFDREIPEGHTRCQHSCGIRPEGVVFDAVLIQLFCVVAPDDPCGFRTFTDQCEPRSRNFDLAAVFPCRKTDTRFRCSISQNVGKIVIRCDHDHIHQRSPSIISEISSQNRFPNSISFIYFTLF